MVFFRLFFTMKIRVSHCALAALLSIGLPLLGLGAERPNRGEPARNNDSTRSDSRLSSQPTADYVLQPQDVLKVHVFQHEDLNKQSEAVSISGDYTIYLPLIQTLSVRGKTVRQVEEMIRVAYDKDYLVNPQVSVNVMKYAERAVNVIGAVGKPDRVPFPPEKGLTIVEAISAAGGPNRYADLKKVKLTRKNEAGESNTEEINVDAMMNRGGRDATPLEKGDVIFVPERIL